MQIFFSDCGIGRNRAVQQNSITPSEKMTHVVMFFTLKRGLLTSCFSSQSDKVVSVIFEWMNSQSSPPYGTVARNRTETLSLPTSHSSAETPMLIEARVTSAIVNGMYGR